MAYTLQALIGREIELRDFADKYEVRPAIPLPQGLFLVPLTAAVREKIDIPLLPLVAEDDSPPPEALDQLGTQASKLGKIGYIEAEIFGGSGNQAAVVWDKQVRTWGPSVSPRAINEVLKILGVQKGANIDEFAALDLGRHRHTEQWVINT